MHVFVALSLLGGGDWELRVVGREGRGEEVGVQESLGRGREDGTHTCTHTHTHTHGSFLPEINPHLLQTCASSLDTPGTCSTDPMPATDKEQVVS